LGDAVHNLRCALDLLVFGMVGAKVPSLEWCSSPSAIERKDFAVPSQADRYSLPAKMSPNDA
jgi:hypothetical protein